MTVFCDARAWAALLCFGNPSLSDWGEPPIQISTTLGTSPLPGISGAARPATWVTDGRYREHFDRATGGRHESHRGSIGQDMLENLLNRSHAGINLPQLAELNQTSGLAAARDLQLRCENAVVTLSAQSKDPTARSRLGSR